MVCCTAHIVDLKSFLNQLWTTFNCFLFVLGMHLFEMCWFYMGIAQIALDPTPSVKQANVEKKCPKPFWQALTPQGKCGEKNALNHFDKPLHPPP